MDAMSGVQWAGRGASNTLAVQKSIEEANRLNIPASHKHLDRLHKFSTQVLSMEYPECPLSWERHSAPVAEAADERGVVWRDRDGYFCAPPGMSPDTLVKDKVRDPVKSPQMLKKEIGELTRDIQYALDPSKKSKADSIEAEIRSRRIAAMSLLDKEERGMYEKEEKKEKEKMEKEEKKEKQVLTKIYERFGLNANVRPSVSGGVMFDKAKACAWGTSYVGCDPVEIPDGPGKTKTIHVPSDIVSENPSQLQEHLQEWWRRYRKKVEEVLAKRKRAQVSRYV